MPRDDEEYPLDIADNRQKYATSIEPLIGAPDGTQILSQDERDNKEIQYLRERDFKRDIVQGEVSDEELHEYLANNAEDWWSEYKYTEEGDKHLRNLFLKGEANRGKGNVVSEHDSIAAFTRPQRRRLQQELHRFHPEDED